MQAALDTTYWTLKSKHLNSEAVLSLSAGSLRLVHKTLHALLKYVMLRAPVNRLIVFTEEQATLDAHIRDSLKSAFRLLKHLVRDGHDDTLPTPLTSRLARFSIRPPHHHQQQQQLDRG